MFILIFFLAVYVTTWIILSLELEGLREASKHLASTFLVLVLSILGVLSFIVGITLYISSYSREFHVRILAIALIGSGILICTIIFLTALHLTFGIPISYITYSLSTFRF